ncbi:succinate dehydrogenase, hydrophobic membrane anchor protein [Candidatus Pantoea carbekii]|uniref:Succinate dehydrogenase hydrophobic membrane anchor subunit n=1 Tax=Candidatus Pantoea carbekii TaxID=1235990 RepID=U3U6W4_9GAMM|nr:succinate dehydrogenase, hydrophobic membrane anchor protein [Candidatus Pantoea carbekii]AKC32194.1 succinate dehydrogenase hydrophobic membrane anchor protein SdhD [Candidatus Pantoea carbekii]BAO00725.1 SdhD protein [Candidatus Pantoea carbekii]
MVSKASSALGRNGIYDWLLLRISAVLISFYILYITVFLIIKYPLTYNIWCKFFAYYFTKIFTLLTLCAILLHGWIGMWQVLTDYVKPIAIRLVLQFIIMIILLFYVIYGVIVVWGI